MASGQLVRLPVLMEEYMESVVNIEGLERPRVLAAFLNHGRINSRISRERIQPFTEDHARVVLKLSKRTSQRGFVDTPYGIPINVDFSGEETDLLVRFFNKIWGKGRAQRIVLKLKKEGGIPLSSTESRIASMVDHPAGSGGIVVPEVRKPAPSRDCNRPSNAVRIPNITRGQLR